MIKLTSGLNHCRLIKIVYFSCDLILKNTIISHAESY